MDITLIMFTVFTFSTFYGNNIDKVYITDIVWYMDMTVVLFRLSTCRTIYSMYMTIIVHLHIDRYVYLCISLHINITNMMPESVFPTLTTRGHSSIFVNRAPESLLFIASDMWFSLIYDLFIYIFLSHSISNVKVFFRIKSELLFERVHLHYNAIT